MLQFIVLGFVPGTHIQITFGWLILFLLASSVILVVAFEYQHLVHFFSVQLNLFRKKPTSKPLA